ncbi:MAG TPA: DUF1707 domain-containing protein [Kribbella sp.]|uniref:DUF1707 SHOCT-like domain-containing protein n=1 Tax=Kribbella sp. TaxID=1871183 RepID=UPI002D7A19F6|nr:DUF1707 domain-containing protein [Kribbella sp.]HET6294085.1 DUF1707 domain-containing protein [Kribbella sp.]
MSPNLPAKSGPIRIGDAERDQAVVVLSDHFVAGRLTQEEFEERSNEATRARYDVDLKPLFADLPEPEPAQQTSRKWSSGSGPRGGRPIPPPLLLLAPLMVGLVVASVALAAPGLLWIMFWIVMFSGPVNHRRWQDPHRR